MKRGLLIISHGSRSADYAADFQMIVDAVREKGLYDFVEGAFMEFAQPDIEAGVRALAEMGADCIVVAPYFLFEGVHIKRDINGKIEKLSEEFPQIDFTVARPIGFEPMMVDIILKRSDEAMEGKDG